MPRHSLWAVVAGVLLMGLVGCGGGNSYEIVDYTRTVTTTGQYRSLQFNATTRAMYHPGETVVVTFTVKNTSDQQVRYTRGGCDDYFAQVTQGNKTVTDFVHIPEESYGCAGIIVQYQFEPGETRKYTLKWDQRKDQSGASNSSLVTTGEYGIQPLLDVYTLDNEDFLTPAIQGKPYPPLGPTPLPVTIR